MASILLVDDEKVARAVYGDYLGDAGHEVTCVDGVAEARAALALRPFDVVVTDLILPSGDGMDVLRHTRERHPDVEVVVITALDKVDPAVRAIKSGAAEYLVKPVTPEALEHAVGRALMTRKLLAENAALKRHLSLVEAGQRLLGMLDRPRLAQAAAAAFQQLSGATGAMVWARAADGSVRLEAAEGLATEALRRHITRFDAELPGLPARRFDVAGTDDASHAVGLPFGEAQRQRGWVVLLGDARVHERAAEPAEVLGHHLALAWEHLERYARVEDLAYLDDLTRLYNARYLDQVLDRELQSGGGPFSLLFLDLDHFKSVNDTHGHLVGSKVLVEAARVVKSCTRDQDVVARWGGDEYVVLLRETDSGGALKVAERIRRTIESHAFLAREGYGLSMRVCIGVSSHPEHAQDKRSLLDLADRAMYRGKRTSRNVVYVAAPATDEAVPRSRSGAA